MQRVTRNSKQLSPCSVRCAEDIFPSITPPSATSWSRGTPRRQASPSGKQDSTAGSRGQREGNRALTAARNQLSEGRPGRLERGALLRTFWLALLAMPGSIQASTSVILVPLSSASRSGACDCERCFEQEAGAPLRMMQSLVGRIFRRSCFLLFFRRLGFNVPRRHSQDEPEVPKINLVQGAAMAVIVQRSEQQVTLGLDRRTFEARTEH